MAPSLLAFFLRTVQQHMEDQKSHQQSLLYVSLDQWATLTLMKSEQLVKVTRNQNILPTAFRGYSMLTTSLFHGTYPLLDLSFVQSRYKQQLQH